MGLSTISLALAVAGLAVFWIGVRNEDETVRWVGIGIVAAALVLRLVLRVTRRSGRHGPSI